MHRWLGTSASDIRVPVAQKEIIEEKSGEEEMHLPVQETASFTAVDLLERKEEYCSHLCQVLGHSLQ